jgi:hypothetical protein
MFQAYFRRTIQATKDSPNYLKYFSMDIVPDGKDYTVLTIKHNKPQDEFSNQTSREQAHCSAA